MAGWSTAVTLNCVYFFLFALGVGYTILVAVMGGLGHLDLPGLDVDIPGVDLHPGEPDIHIEFPFDAAHSVDHPEVGLSPLSPITIATFVTTFGGVGLVLNNLTTLSPVLGLFISASSGFVLAGGVFLLYARLLGAAQASSEIVIGTLIGKRGETTSPIPGDGVGEVAMIAQGSRITVPARSATGETIPRGTRVVITDLAGGVALARPDEDKGAGEQGSKGAGEQGSRGAGEQGSRVKEV